MGSFESLQNRLIVHIRERVRSGELTERGLARLTGLSQPHLHNVLKGVRSLSMDYTDRILVQLELSIPDLLTPAELQKIAPSSRRATTADLPRLRGSVGPSYLLEERAYPGDVYPVSRTLLDSLTNPILVTLGYDPLLYPYFQDGDLALIDRQLMTAGTLDASAVYLVRTLEGMLVRSLRFGGARLSLLTPATMDKPRNWSHLPLLGKQLADVVWGRLVWLQRHLRSMPFGPGAKG